MTSDNGAMRTRALLLLVVLAYLGISCGGEVLKHWNAGLGGWKPRQELGCEGKSGLQETRIIRSCNKGRLQGLNLRGGGELEDELADEAYYKGATQVLKRSTTFSQMVERGDLMASEFNRNKIILVMVGLPGRGKSFISRKIELFLSWTGVKTRVFNVGRYRRSDEAAPANNNRAEFFDMKNQEAVELREKAALRALEDLLDWLDGSGQVAILDATNSQEKRRKMIWTKAFEKNPTFKTLFVESICDDKFMLEENFKAKVRNSPDFRGMRIEDALRDLRERIKNYESAYETVLDDTLSYIKLFNLSSKVMCNKIYGRMASSLLPYLMAVNIGTRPIYLVRAGSSTEFATEKPEGSHGTHRLDKGSGKVAVLKEEGLAFSKTLATWVKEQAMSWMVNNGVSCPALRLAKRTPKYANWTGAEGDVEGQDNEDVEGPDDQERPHDQPLMRVFTSTLPRAMNTVEPLGLPFTSYPQLNPLDKGELSRWTLADVLTYKPHVVDMFKKDPFNYRFPGGESFADVVHRLEPVLIEIEQQTSPVLVVSHSSTLTALYSYFAGVSIEECHNMAFPTHHVIELTPVLGGSWIERRYAMHRGEDGTTSIGQASGPTPLTVAAESQGSLPASIFPRENALV